MIFPLLTVRENLETGFACLPKSERAVPDEIYELFPVLKEMMGRRGGDLSGGQQQRLTLARALSLEPEILCLDEFSIAIDPVTTMKIEDVLTSLKSEMTIILVTNLIQQAQRISDNMMFLNNSEIVEQGPTPELFANPKNELTARYLSGEMG